MTEGWIERYGAMFDGMHEGFTNPNWKDKVSFVGYEAFGGYNPLVWDGGGPSYYTHNWWPITDYTITSPQVWSMNWLSALEETYKENADFLFEILTHSWKNSILSWLKRF